MATRSGPSLESLSPLKTTPNDPSPSFFVIRYSLPSSRVISPLDSVASSNLLIQAGSTLATSLASGDYAKTRGSLTGMSKYDLSRGGRVRTKVAGGVGGRASISSNSAHLEGGSGRYLIRSSHGVQISARCRCGQVSSSQGGRVRAGRAKRREAQTPGRRGR